MRSQASRICRQKAAAGKLGLARQPGTSRFNVTSHIQCFSTTSPPQYPRNPAKGKAFVLSTDATPSGDHDHEASLFGQEHHQVSPHMLFQTGGGPPPEPPMEKPRRGVGRPRGTATQGEADASTSQVAIPPSIASRIVWDSAESSSMHGDSTNPPEAPSPNLPPGYMLDDALTNLYMTLNPHVQVKACTGAAPEPTLALYCPIEGGHYVIDEAVKSLAQASGADVIVLDAVELAAGQYGQFGKAASAFHFTPNPLHQTAAESAPYQPRAPAAEEEGQPSVFLSSPSVSISMPTSMRISGSMFNPSRSSTNSTSNGSSPGSRMKSFFDELVSIPSQPLSSTKADSTSNAKRPRLIYIRDFHVLSEEASSWYPALLASVRSRRIGPLSRPSPHVINPTTIVFGVGPPLYEPSSAGRLSRSTPGAPPPGLLGILLGSQKQPPQRQSNDDGPTTPTNPSINEARLRERRLKERLRRWDAGGDAALRVQLPEYDYSPTGSSRDKPKASGLPPGFPQPLAMLFGGAGEGMARAEPRSNEDSSSGESDYDGYWRVSGVVPAQRDLLMEKVMRIERRTHINQLLVRMRLGSVGAAIESMELASDSENDTPLSFPDEWGKKILSEDEVREVVDHAVAQTVALKNNQPDASTLQTINVPWPFVLDAWSVKSNKEHERRLWIDNCIKAARTMDNDAQESTSSQAPPLYSESDEIIDKVKSDPSLTPHEQRLLSCIVDPSSMPTTFASVHLPEKTIDAIRTMVSLPLLYPKAFEEGLLKTHSMTGALLLGPPGVGKTLLARAVAKESGARMLVVKPSDVMDMYVGEGEKLVRSVFSLARRLSPCVIFLDEVDALFASRVSSRETGGTAAHRGVITEFMQEMDGLKTSRANGNVVVIGATNRPFDLDDAVLRRLPRRLLVDLPGEKERQEILKILLRDEALASDVNLASIAKRTATFSGSDLKHLCVSAVLDAIKETVKVPWNVASSTPLPSTDTVDPAVSNKTSQTSSPTSDDGSLDTTPSVRMLHNHHFTKALSEITPSSSESLGTLNELRKWNDEFGEGRTNKGKKRGWGEKFGFGGKEGSGNDGRVMPSDGPSS